MFDRIIRLIIDGPCSATLNMAVDEVLLEGQKVPGILPVLRFYRWNVPAVSIGYFQSVVRAAKTSPGLPIVRRITGGGAVSHGCDLTFSFSAPVENIFIPRDVKDSYLKVNEAVMAGLRRAFPAADYADCRTVPSGRANDERVCFEAPSCYDLMLDGKKIVGASQRRKDGFLLHQSSILLRKEPDGLLPLLLEGFREKWRVEFKESGLTAEELEAARRKEAERYVSAEWAMPVFETEKAGR